jgi:hypothetical protein
VRFATLGFVVQPLRGKEQMQAPFLNQLSLRQPLGQRNQRLIDLGAESAEKRSEQTRLACITDSRSRFGGLNVV